MLGVDDFVTLFLQLDEEIKEQVSQALEELQQHSELEV